MAQPNNNTDGAVNKGAATACFDTISRMQMTARECKKLGELVAPLFPEIGKQITGLADQARTIEEQLTDAICARMSQ